MSADVNKLEDQIQEGESRLRSLASASSNMQTAHKEAKSRLKAAEKDLNHKTR